MIDRLKAIPILSTIWLINLVFRFIKVESAWKIGECLGTLCCRIMPNRRAIIDYNMQIVAKATGDFTPSAELTESIFRRNFANLACTLKTYGMRPDQLAKIVDINVSSSFLETLKDGSGAILCLAHMGNWEILSKIAPLVSSHFVKFGAIYRPLNSKTADNYVATQRQEYNCQMFPKSTPPGVLSSFIRQGGILGILADQRSGRSNKNNRPFFGKDSARSKLPAILQLRTGAPLFSLTVHSQASGRWTIDIESIPLSNRKLNTDEIVEKITQRYQRNFRTHLLDVFWLHRYWK